MNEKKLEEYAQFLPDDIVAEAADIAPVKGAPGKNITENGGKTQGSGSSGSGKGRNRRTTALKYAAVALLFVAAVTAGTVFAIRFGKKNGPGEPGDLSLTGASLPPELPTPGPGETGAPDPAEIDSFTPVPIDAASISDEGAFIAPENSSSYRVLIDDSTRVAYPSIVPEYVCIAPDGKAYFTIVEEVGTANDPLVGYYFDSDRYSPEGSITMTLEYLCSTEKAGDTLKLSTAAIYIKVDFSSEKDRAYYESLGGNYDGEDSRKKKAGEVLQNLLDDGLIYRYSAGPWHALLYQPETVNGFSVKLSGSSGLLIAVDTSVAAAKDPDITSLSFEYEGGKVVSSVILHQNQRLEFFYENGKVKRELISAKDNLSETIFYTEITYGDGVTAEHHYSDSGTDDRVIETYYDHPDLLCSIEKVTEKRRSRKSDPYTVNYTETHLYYFDESRTETYTARLVQEKSQEDIYRLRTVTEHDSHNNMTLYLKEDISGYRLETRTEYIYTDGVLTEYFRSGSETERPTYYEHVKIGPHGEHYYSEYKVPDTGEYRMIEYRPTGSILVRRFYDPVPDSEGIARRCAIYYDENSKEVKTVPFNFVDGQWVEG